MNLNTVEEIWRSAPGSVFPSEWRDGDSWLAGGTWLFSEPQPGLRRLIDLQGLAWEPLVTADEHLRIAATCTIAELDAFDAPADWAAAPLIGECCRAFLSSFKVWNTATVGGNICMSLPAGPMISLAAALEGSCEIWSRTGEQRQVAIEAFVTGNNRNLLEPGDLLRSIDLPISALRKQTAMRRMSLTQLGRSSVLLIGTRGADGALSLAVTASTVRPVRITFGSMPGANELCQAIDDRIEPGLYHDDVHGSPAYRRHLTYHFAEEIRQELAG